MAKPADMTIKEKNAYAEFGRKVAAMLGASYEWDGAADYLDGIAGFAKTSGLPDVGDTDNLEHYRAIADSLDIEHDGNEEGMDEDDA
jgi:hypothetical protein